MPALWITASKRPSLLTSSATVLAPAMLERSPETTPPAPAAAASASRLRPSFRPCNTTSWPWSIRSRAAMRPRPSDDPVMNTRATPPTPPVVPADRLTIRDPLGGRDCRRTSAPFRHVMPTIYDPRHYLPVPTCHPGLRVRIRLHPAASLSQQ